MQNKYTTNYWDYMDFIGGEVKFYKNDNYYCSIKLLSLQEYLWEEYNEIISMLYMKENERLEFAKKFMPFISVKTTRDYFVALFQFYDKEGKFFKIFSQLFPWIIKLKFGFGTKKDWEMIEEETLESLINHFLYYNSFLEEMPKPQQELTPSEKRRLEMEERIKRIKKDSNKKNDTEFSYSKAIITLLKEFPSMSLKDIMNLPLKWFFALTKVGYGYPYYTAQIIALGNGLIKDIKHYTEDKKNE